MTDKDKKKSDDTLLEKIAIKGLTVGIKAGSKVTKVAAKATAKASLATSKFTANVTKGVAKNLVEDIIEEKLAPVKQGLEEFKEKTNEIKTKITLTGEEIKNKTKEYVESLNPKPDSPES